MISEVARSSANIGYGARTRWANFFHGLFLLLAVLFAVPFIEMIPSVALSAMLVFVGFRLAHPKHFITAWHIGKEQLLIFATTVIVTISTDLLMGVGSGILLEFAVNLMNGAKLKDLFKSSTTIDENEVEFRVIVNGPMLFSNILGYKKVLARAPKDKKLIIDVSEAPMVDHTSIVTMNDLKENLHNEGTHVEVQGFEHHVQLSKAPTSTRILKKA
jgi:MFS superfamily sulfate permease-like transporter